MELKSTNAFTMAFSFYYDNQITQNEKQPVCFGEVLQSL